MAKTKNNTRVELPFFAEKEIDTTGVIAHHYGFIPIINPTINSVDKTKVKLLKEQNLYPLVCEERVSLLRFFHESGLVDVPQPALLYVKKPFTGSGQKKKAGIETCELEVVNSSRAVAEALIIKTAWSILEEDAQENMYVEINSVGDKESFAKFERELSSYFKKNMQSLSATDRNRFKADIFEIPRSTEVALEGFRANAPKSMSSLSEQSRDHFKEVLEFLESFDIPYRIAHHLLPQKGHISHTLFEIRKSIQSKKGEVTELLGYGGRYNYLGKKIGYKKEFPSCGITLSCVKKTSHKKFDITKIAIPQVYMVQLGNHAKLKMLNIVELLRKEKIIVYHSLTKEKITGQLSSAEYLGVSHLLIIGQKEAIDNTVVVRSVDTREQETVHIDELVNHLKQLLK